MKAILMSVHAKWCALMMNGDKTIEVRKGTALYKAIQKLIDEYGYADIYVYCTMAKHIKDYLQIENGKYACNVPKDYESELNGKVIFKFRCYKVEHFEREYPSRYIDDYYYDNGEPLNKKFYKQTCLTEEELFDYIGSGEGCAIHISDLEVFDKPKGLSEFYKVCSFRYNDLCAAKDKLGCQEESYLQENMFGGISEQTKCGGKIAKAPQSFMYVEV